MKFFVAFLGLFLMMICGAAARAALLGDQCPQGCLDRVCVNWHPHDCQDPGFPCRILWSVLLISHASGLNVVTEACACASDFRVLRPLQIF